VKIAIACYPTHGGSGVVASELALGLARRGHQIHIVSYAVPFRLRSFHPSVRVHEVEVSTYPLFKYPPYTLGLATKLAEVASEESIDIVHAHYAVPHAVSAFLAKQIAGGSPRIITTLHGTDITLVGADRAFHRVIRFALEVSDGVTAVSKYLERRTVREFAIERPVEVIYNFVDPERCRRADSTGVPRSHWARSDQRILLHASNFRPLKRVADAVRVFARVRKEIPARLLLVGEGPDRPSAQQLVRELGISDDVRFLGEQDYIESMLACADLLLLPSEEESFGLVALEAMSCEVPVIASRVGGLPEVVLDGETGYLLGVGEVEAMAEAALRLLRDDAKRERLGRRGREWAIEQFNAANIIPQYERYYERVLKS